MNFKQFERTEDEVVLIGDIPMKDTHILLLSVCFYHIALSECIMCFDPQSHRREITEKV